MDSLTQIVLGGAIGNAVAGKKLKNRAVLYGAIAGTIPDLDVVVGWMTDPLTALEIHRGVSHSILFAIFASFLLGFVVYKIEKKNGLTYEEGYWLFFWGLFTHSILDVFTSWGTRVLWPFDYMFAFKSIFVIDPLYTLPFIYFLIRSMREKNNLRKRMRFNNLGLIVSSSYLALTLLLKALAFYKFTDALDRVNVSYSALSVKPTAMNVVLWNGIVETKDSFLIGEYSFFDTSEIKFQTFPKNHEYQEHLENHVLLKRLIKVSEGQYTFTEDNDKIFFNDLRFGLLKNDEEDIQFAFSYDFYVDDDGQLSVREVKKEKRDGVKLLRKLWKRMGGV
ncbi:MULTISPECIES: metal-dependent hydrolase [Myroides]|uniref:Metal-dependent hydrolase n=1 Tax=Myroides albus TaxID=2562892 RepID=A0A6I3LJ20_9FLAO|nr:MULTISPECIES: metal-dependent hydrolase [Myroides]MTG97814.1 metal-dependent hydrolase [Myroides albus]MVX37147.1 metal-dependent hydrolase [Myroides sp. LoEW2-1]UVD79771.1 metal-dependent hydrolase [Myroides albus]